MAVSTPLVAVELVAASIWVGSLVCLAVVAAAARQVLDGPNQVRLFRSVGQRYGILGTAALLAVIGAGLALAWPPSSWSATIDAAVAVAGALLLLTSLAMIQARRMSKLRQRSLSAPHEVGVERAVSRGRRLAGGLRATMGVATLAVVILAAQAITH
jgi:putative copper export protein